jgi:protoporphyrinogen/coproporphyrinogen III oxidase
MPEQAAPRELRVVVVGGGISGLATAYFLRQAIPACAVVVLESEGRVGGNVRTLRIGGADVDAGPDAVLVGRPAAASLCGALGTGARMIAPRAEARRVNLAMRRRLVPMPEGLALGVPTGLLPLLRTPLISLAGKARATLDLVLPRDASREQSVGALIERRLGREIKDTLVEPMLGAIYAADVDSLDPAVALPFMTPASGGLLRSLASAPRPSGGPAMMAPEGGMIQLIEALLAAVGHDAFRVSSPVRALRRTARGSLLVETVLGGSTEADVVILAVPPAAAARIVEDLEPGLAGALGDLRATSTASVVLTFPSGTALPPGSGMLIPRTEGRATLAATFVGSKWGRPSERGEVVVRALLGGARAPGLAAASSDDELVARALEDLRAYTPLPDPSDVRVVRYLGATPEHRPGHAERVRAIRATLASSPGLHLVHAAYEGPGVAGCASQAAAVASAIAAS